MLKIEGVAMDKFRRINIPTIINKEFPLDNHAYITTNENGCICVYRENNNSLYLSETGVHNFSGDKNIRRLVIPINFLSCNTFYFGNKVTIILFEDHIELWPYKSEEG